MIGIPVISTNVGGISSLVENMVTGLLIPANDPWMLSQTIISLFKDKELMKTLGMKGRENAILRHDRLKILDCNIDIYNQIINLERKAKENVEIS
jgi:glycosyltransferase involved in cell wall biosynthesis